MSYDKLYNARSKRHEMVSDGGTGAKNKRSWASCNDALQVRSTGGSTRPVGVIVTPREAIIKGTIKYSRSLKSLSFELAMPGPFSTCVCKNLGIAK